MPKVVTQPDQNLFFFDTTRNPNERTNCHLICYLKKSPPSPPPTLVPNYILRGKADCLCNQSYTCHDKSLWCRRSLCIKIKSWLYNLSCNVCNDLTFKSLGGVGEVLGSGGLLASNCLSDITYKLQRLTDNVPFQYDTQTVDYTLIRIDWLINWLL